MSRIAKQSKIYNLQFIERFNFKLVSVEITQ